MSEDNNAHHVRQEYCKTRLDYRQGRHLKAVKVYTVANESQHILVFGVPKINLQQELRRSFVRFGALDLITCVTEQLAKKVELELFTDVFHIKFNRIEHARRAKRFLDTQQFYGGILHVSYAPEYETLEELRHKLQKRKNELNYRIHKNCQVESNVQSNTLSLQQ